MSQRSHLAVAVVGATGVVGRTMVQVLTERGFPIGELRLLASGRSAGRSVSVAGRTLEVGKATPEAFEGIDIALFSAGGEVSTALAPAAASRGATVIDNSSAWRMDPAVPLVVSQVNQDALEWHEGIVANPNCSTMQLAPVLMAIRDAVGLERVIVDTYQSVSGTGAEAIAELESQVRAHVTGEPSAPSVYPHRIAFNALPAALSPDMWAHQYDQQANQVVCAVCEDRVYTNNGPDSNIFGLEPNYGCCTANLHQGWPKFVASLWMASPDDGLVAIAYGPNRVETTVRGGVRVRIDEETDYPFRGEVGLAGSPAQDEPTQPFALVEEREGE